MAGSCTGESISFEISEKTMSDYILHMDWNWWEESLTFYKREYLLKFLRSGFVPQGCKLTVEHEGELYEWDRDADYAKGYRYAGMMGKPAAP
jgi:hypothetical protein